MPESRTSVTARSSVQAATDLGARTESAPVSHRLTFQMVPMWLWRRNLRALMTKWEWTKHRKSIISERGLRCSICGRVVAESKSIFCHEEWNYDSESWIATLTGFALTCWDCHATEHWGHTTRMVCQGRYPRDTLERLTAHFMTVNGCTKADFDSCLDAAVERFSGLSGAMPWTIEWGLYSDWVAENYEGDPFEGVPHLL
jgi:hypothetical protein